VEYFRIARSVYAVAAEYVLRFCTKLLTPARVELTSDRMKLLLPDTVDVNELTVVDSDVNCAAVTPDDQYVLPSPFENNVKFSGIRLLSLVLVRIFLTFRLSISRL